MRILLGTAAIAASVAAAVPAQAQSTLERRVDRVEQELRAVQRKVFPEGAGTYFEPQITAPQQQPNQPGSPVSGPLVNLESRVNALESQISNLTGQVEQSQYQVRQLQDAFDAYKKATDARLAAMEGGGTGMEGTGSGTRSDSTGGNMATPPPGVHGNGVLTPSGNQRDDTGPSRPAVSGARADKVSAVERPDSGDSAEDAYIYGYRLWNAGLYPEAEAQLKSVVEKYPKNRRASFAQNLLGRSYLDEGKPSLAAIAFYDNYKKMPDGERAADSLFYLGKTLIQLKRTKDACQVYDVLSESYPDKISLDMQAEIDRNRDAAKCS